MKLARLLVGIGTCVFAMATSAAAQVSIDGGMYGPGSFAEAKAAKAAGPSTVTRTFTITKTAGGGFPAGTYGCFANIGSPSESCIHATEVGFWSPSGIKLAEDSDSPMCQMSYLVAEAYLDENAESGTYTCAVVAFGTDYISGGPMNGWREFSRYWGDGASMLKSKGVGTRFITPIKTLDE